jgi:hypothetical protein
MFSTCRYIICALDGKYPYRHVTADDMCYTNLTNAGKRKTPMSVDAYHASGLDGERHYLGILMACDDTTNLTDVAERYDLVVTFGRCHVFCLPGQCG